MPLSLEADLLHLLALPTWVTADGGEPGRHEVATLIREGVVPLLERRQPDEIRRHPYGDVAARFGPDNDEGLVLIAYVVAQHGAPDDRHPALVGSKDDRRVLGRGAAQCKGALAAALTAIDLLQHRLRRPMWLAVNAEGSSSHDGSRRLLGELGVRGRAGVVLAGTDLRISRGNRGRADVVVRIDGIGCHSSQPDLGSNPFDRLGEVLVRLGDVHLPDPHPDLGPATMTPFAVRAEPVAPHTVPSALILTIDRRLLPGEEPAAAVSEVVRALRGVPGVRVSTGRTMLPAWVDAADPVIRALADGLRAAGRPEDVVVSRHTFDAGYACSVGMPTAMFGPGRRQFGPGLLEPEEVRIDDCNAAAAAIAATVATLCT